MRKNNKNLTIGIIGILVVVGLVFFLSQLFVQGVTVNSNSDYVGVSYSIPQVNENIISVDQVFQLREEGAYLLDVRTQEEWDQAHIPGASLIPLDEFQVRINELPKDQDIVIYCRSGNRSMQALNLLQSVGFSNIYGMAGGIQDWVNTGYPVE